MRARWIIIFALYYANIFAKDVTNTYPNGIKSGGKMSEVETLLENLLQQQWNEDEVPCVEATQALLLGVRNQTLWATWMWDSMQRPTGVLYGSRYQLGNFDQCMKPLWEAVSPDLGAQYCLADIDMTRETPRKPSGPVDPFDLTQSYMNKTTKHGRHLNVVTVGVCLPRVCRPPSVARVVRLLLRHWHLAAPALEPLVSVHSCQLAGEQHQYSQGFFAFFYVMTTICAFALLCTCSFHYLPANSSVGVIAKCFNLKYNFKKLAAGSKDEVRSANGIKFSTTSMGTSIHLMAFASTVAIFNGIDFEKYLETSFGFYTLHIDLVTDTFYAVSGLLLAKSLLSGKQKNGLKNLVKRYLRIFPPLAVMVFYMACVHSHVGDGPLWPAFSGDLQRTCLDNWWLNLLLINNYVNADRICNPVTWYISTDFQLVLVGTLLCYIYRRDSRTGKIAFTSCFVISMLMTALITYWKELPTTLFGDIHEVIHFTSNKVFVERYIKTQYRAGSYLVGMALGYIMVRYRPEEYRNTISKGWSTAGTLLAFLVMFVLMTIGGHLYNQEDCVVQHAAFSIVNRILWALAICSIIGLCEYGTVPIVQSYLNMYMFVPLSRLCYGIYLSHMTITYYFIHSIRAPIRYDYVSMIISGTGIGVFSLLLSFLLWMFVEAPVCNLTKYILDTKTGEGVTDGTVKGNEAQSKSKPKAM